MSFKLSSELLNWTRSTAEGPAGPAVVLSLQPGPDQNQDLTDPASMFIIIIRVYPRDLQVLRAASINHQVFLNPEPLVGQIHVKHKLWSWSRTLQDLQDP